MFKDYDKYLSTSLKVYLFVLIIIFIMKLVGLDYFGIDLNNSLMLKINDYLLNHRIIRNLVYFIPLIINQYIILSITLNDKSKKMLIYNIILLPILYVFECYKIKLFGNFAMLAEVFYFVLLIVIYKRKIKIKDIKRLIIIILLTIIFQTISTLTRFRYSIKYVNNLIANLLLNLDYIIIVFIIYKLYFMKGVKEQWIYLVEVSSSSLKKINLKKSLKKLQKNWRKFKKQDKVTKLTFIIFFILSLIWNVLSVVIILFIAILNDTFIECIFILTSFWLSKRAFGKAFHLSSMAQCFIVSNLTYYALNRITTPLGISIVIPIMLGVGLSYVTSKLVKKTYKPLYRGMPRELFEETILKVTDKNSMKYKICYDFYINKKSIISLALKYNYTESGIRKIKDRINDKIKRLD